MPSVQLACNQSLVIEMKKEWGREENEREKEGWEKKN